MLSLEAPTQARRSSISSPRTSTLPHPNGMNGGVGEYEMHGNGNGNGNAAAQHQYGSPNSQSQSHSHYDSTSPQPHSSQIPPPSNSQLQSSYPSHQRPHSSQSPTSSDPALDPTSPENANLDPLALKRRQNTVAARRSRQRKLEHVRALEAEVVQLRGERDALRERCGVLEERVGFLRGMVVGSKDV